MIKQASCKYHPPTCSKQGDTQEEAQESTRRPHTPWISLQHCADQTTSCFSSSKILNEIFSWTLLSHETWIYPALGQNRRRQLAPIYLADKYLLATCLHTPDQPPTCLDQLPRTMYTAPNTLINYHFWLPHILLSCIWSSCFIPFLVKSSFLLILQDYSKHACLISWVWPPPQNESWIALAKIWAANV